MTDISLYVPRGKSSAQFATEEIHKHLRSTLVEGRLETLNLVMADLVTNAVQHGQGRIHVRVVFNGVLIRCEVSDEGSGCDQVIREAAETSTTGGLSRMRSTVSDWGVHGGHTSVWFEISLNDRPDLDAALQRRETVLAEARERAPVVPRHYP
jgi:anti-sigma regulatory factor (Ser/Thr protein kinase)